MNGANKLAAIGWFLLGIGLMAIGLAMLWAVVSGDTVTVNIG